MKGEEFKIKFIGKNAYLNENKYINTEDMVDLPKPYQFFKSKAYWKVKILNYLPMERKIHCEVISYNNGDTEFETNQIGYQNQLQNIDIITFRSIDTNGLLKTSSAENQGTFLPEKSHRIYRSNPVDYLNNENDYHPSTKLKIIQPIKSRFNEYFNIEFEKIEIIDNGITFNYKTKYTNQKIEVTITNIFLKKEFDSVKNYFTRVLGTKKINVTLIFETTPNEIKIIYANSKEIDKINSDFIDQVKFTLLKSIIKKINTENDNSILTMEESFKHLEENSVEASTFYSDSSEYLNDLLKIKKSKHYDNLRFLSSKHLSGIMKLRFIYKPLSFIFIIGGGSNYYLIWETHSSKEATYIWPTIKEENEARKALKEITNVILKMTLQGKTDYIKNSEENFYRVFHDYKEGIEGFKKWKNEFEQIIK